MWFGGITTSLGLMRRAIPLSLPLAYRCLSKSSNLSVDHLEKRLLGTVEKEVGSYGRVVAVVGETCHIAGIERARKGSLIRIGNHVGLILNLTREYAVGLLLEKSCLPPHDLTNTSVEMVMEKILIDVPADTETKDVHHCLDLISTDSNQTCSHSETALFREAPSLMQRKPATSSEFLFTGYKYFDFLLPIARGIRLGLMGSIDMIRQTVLTLLEQIPDQNSSPTSSYRIVYCTTQGIASKHISKVRQVLRTLSPNAKAAIVYCDSSDLLGAQYLTPFAACSLAEAWRDQGHQVILVYDELCHHAECIQAIEKWCSISRLAARSQHSVLLERSGLLRDNRSLTVLAMVGDRSSPLLTGGVSQDANPFDYIPSLVDMTLTCETLTRKRSISLDLDIAYTLGKPLPSYHVSWFKLARFLKYRLTESREMIASKALAEQLEITVEDEVLEKMELYEKFQLYITQVTPLSPVEEIISLYGAFYLLSSVSREAIPSMEGILLDYFKRNGMYEELHKYPKDQPLPQDVIKQVENTMYQCMLDSDNFTRLPDL